MIPVGGTPPLTSISLTILARMGPLDRSNLPEGECKVEEEEEEERVPSDECSGEEEDPVSEP